ncbi:MAG TPA: YfiR family protein [Verrucomicrobiae bacterium]|nr:YfiR family protein [Verrucomicrobiae bacterium]
MTSALLASTWLFAEETKPSEYQVEATYLYNFGRFVQWPANTSANSFAVCVLGQDPFGSALDATLSGESLDGKPVVIRRVVKAQDATTCQILFINANEDARLREILTVLDGNSVLTVSDMAGFSRRGGMIQFLLDGGRVRFEVNLSSAENARLTLSSELLKVATTVRKNARSGD